MIGKSAMIAGKGYIRVNLTEEETNKAMDELIKFNIKELQRVVMETKNSTIMAINQTEAIKLLFEKQGMAAYTYLQTKLDNKIDDIKQLPA
jgi:transcriptional/translational regulatory protein YebC/TACO1